jgi:hypothetical protein
MGTNSMMSHRRRPCHLVAGLAVLGLALAGAAPAQAQAQIGGALPSLSVPPTLPTPLNPPSLTPLAPMTAPALTPAAPAPQAATPAPAAARAQPAQR